MIRLKTCGQEMAAFGECRSPLTHASRFGNHDVPYLYLVTGLNVRRPNAPFVGLMKAFKGFLDVFRPDAPSVRPSGLLKLRPAF